MRVKVVQLGGATTEIPDLEEGGTVRQALNAARYSSVPEGYQVRLDREPVDLDTELYDGAIVTLVQKTKAGV